jgi:hypothetical protein
MRGTRERSGSWRSARAPNECWPVLELNNDGGITRLHVIGVTNTCASSKVAVRKHSQCKSQQTPGIP